MPTDTKVFYERITQRLQTFLTTLLADEPELRSVGVALDYQGELNKAAPGLVWCGRGAGGVVNEADAIAGSVGQTARLLALQSSRAVQLGQQIQTRIEAATNGERQKQGRVAAHAGDAERAAQEPVDRDLGRPVGG